jgi:hypothetical protein
MFFIQEVKIISDMLRSGIMKTSCDQYGLFLTDKDATSIGSMLLNQLDECKTSEQANRLRDFAYMLLAANKGSKKREFLLHELRSNLEQRLEEINKPLFEKEETGEFGCESNLGILTKENEWKWRKLADLLGIDPDELTAGKPYKRTSIYLVNQ